jgi:hypothetical protein
VVLLAGAAGADPTGSSVALAPHGDAIDGTAGQPVALTPTSFLVPAEGADGLPGTADDLAVLVTGVGRTPATRALATGYGATGAARIERLSATRAVLVTAGVDGTFGSADDGLLLLERLGSADLVVPIVLGGLGDSQQYTPERLAADTVAIPGLGADLLPDTADDEVTVVRVAPAPAVVTRLSAPYQRAGGRTRLVALSPTAFLLSSDGPDRKSTGADDLVYSFRFAAGTWSRTDLAAPGLNRRSAGRPVRLDPDRGLVVSAGPDFVDSTGDDEVLLLDGAAGTVTHLAVPFARNSSGGQPTPLSASSALVGTRGADGLDGTADDAVALLADLGGADAVSSIVVGPSSDNNQCRPVRLRATSFALATLGADAAVGTADDSLTVVTGVGGRPLVQTVVVGALAAGTSSTVVALSERSLAVTGGGPDQTVGTGDDEVVVLSGIGAALALHTVPLGGAVDAPDEFRFVPVVLGGRRAVVLSSGPDDALGAGGDDAVRVLDELELRRSLRVRRLKARFARGDGAATGRPSRLEVEGAMVLEEPEALLEEDLTLSVGNAAQTFAAGTLVPYGEGRYLRHDDPAGEAGPVRRLRIDLRRGTIRVDLRGADDEVASTDPGYVPVGLDLGGILVPDAVEARARQGGFRFRRPRGAE